MLRQGAPVREFTDPEAMRAHYRALQARLFAPRAVRPRHQDPRTRALVEAQREREQREAEERLAATFAAQAEMDALVFQILDPEQIAREPKRIIARVAAAFGFTCADIVGDRRTHDVVRARFAAIAAVREAHPDWSTTKLGQVFNRDHTSILHAIRKMERTGIPQRPVTDAAA